MNSDLSKIEPVNVPMTQSQTPKVETELSSSKPVVANLGKKSKGGTNKAGPKTTWVPKTNLIIFGVCREEERIFGSLAVDVQAI